MNVFPKLKVNQDRINFEARLIASCRKIKVRIKVLFPAFARGDKLLHQPSSTTFFPFFIHSNSISFINVFCWKPLPNIISWSFAVYHSRKGTNRYQNGFFFIWTRLVDQAVQFCEENRSMCVVSHEILVLKVLFLLLLLQLFSR